MAMQQLSYCLCAHSVLCLGPDRLQGSFTLTANEKVTLKMPVGGGEKVQWL